MTDNEIIKALECCFEYNEGCDKCPIEDECLLHQPQPILLNHTLDLINRQQAEIERLRYNLEAVLNERADHSEAIKEFAEKLKEHKHECGCNYRKKPVYAVTEEKIDNLVKEMVGDAE